MKIGPAMPLVLGSASPRRRELVAMLGVPFVVHVASADETVLPGESPLGYLERVTLAKLEATRREGLGSAAGVLVADTIVIGPGGVILGKPRDEDDALATLERLSASTHQVATRFALAPASPGTPPAHAQTVTTRVTFRAMSRGEIRDYVALGEGKDKAGGYAVQGHAAVFVDRIDGSFTNVVGLPICDVLVAMRAIGWIEAR